MKKLITFSVIFLLLCSVMQAQTTFSLVATHHGSNVIITNQRLPGGTDGSYFREVFMTGNSQPNGLGLEMFDVEFALRGFTPFKGNAVTVDMKLSTMVPVLPGGTLVINFMVNKIQVGNGQIILDSLSFSPWKRFTVNLPDSSALIQEVSFVIISSQTSIPFFVNVGIDFDNIVLKKNSGDLLLTSFEEEVVVGIEKPRELAIPNGFVLNQNYPNPFNPTTNISFSTLQAEHVRVLIYDALGREVAMLADGILSAGSHIVKFNAQNLPSGIYICRVIAGNTSQVKKMTLLK